MSEDTMSPSEDDALPHVTLVTVRAAEGIRDAAALFAGDFSEASEQAVCERFMAYLDEQPRERLPFLQQERARYVAACYMLNAMVKRLEDRIWELNPNVMFADRVRTK